MLGSHGSGLFARARSRALAAATFAVLCGVAGLAHAELPRPSVVPRTVPALAPAAGGYLPAEADRWTRRGSLIDVRYEAGPPLDLGAELAAGRFARLDLPFHVAVDGGRYGALLVGHGWVRFVNEDDDGEELLGPRIDVLAGEGVRTTGGRVPCRLGPRGVAIRWTELDLPTGGTASVELVLDRVGHVTAQYLRLPGAATEALRFRALSAGTSGVAGDLGLRPEPASAFTLFQPVYEVTPVERPGVDRPRPRADGPPPSGCEPSAGSWCAEVDGGESIILIQDNFDDLDSRSRGWTATSLWHESTWDVCVTGRPGSEVGGADSNPGGAWYFGEDATCQYLDDEFGILQSGDSTERVTTTTVAEFMTRIGFDTAGDSANVLLNGFTVATMPLTLEPDRWYNLRLGSISEGAPFFAPWLGATVRIGFRFISNATVSDLLGWFIDDVRVWDEAVGRPGCLLSRNGSVGISDCGDLVATRWSFPERENCSGCDYTFYVSAECGSELHFPLFDFNGGQFRITNVVTGEPVSLRCVNSTARAEAGLGDYEYVMEQTCPSCFPPEQQWWSPPFDQTDNIGVGGMDWGLPFCDGLDAYDVDLPPDGVQCDEVPCGGELAFLSPGAGQTMDCFIEDPGGLCGLYRVDVVSGAGRWDLFANCDGSDVPEFEIYRDCTQAWASWDSLIAIAGADLYSCPGEMVMLDATATELGPCTDAQYRWLDETGTELGAWSPDPTLLVPFDSCADGASYTLEVSCSEVGCTSRDVVRVDCLVPRAEAGSLLTACPDGPAVLDGSASVVPGCDVPEYRWLDDTGAELRTWTTSTPITQSRASSSRAP